MAMLVLNTEGDQSIVHQSSGHKCVHGRGSWSPASKSL